MKILVACEESQVVTKALRKLGHKAFSCDILPCDGGKSQWHYMEDVLPLLNISWDMIIAFPPCTHIACSGAKHFAIKRLDGRQQKAVDFFMKIANANCLKIAIENPVGIMSTHWRTPDQIIQPYQFGDSFQKTTCIWLKGLPKLIPTNIVDKGKFYTSTSGKKIPEWYNKNLNTKKGNRQKSRGITFQGIANAMAMQWSGDITKNI